MTGCRKTIGGGIKGRFPWRLGATSYVVPADLITNVRALAPLVDDVQLLFFESAANSGMDHPLDPAGLLEVAAAHDLSFTVHLPVDIRLGHADVSIRRQGIDEIMRLMIGLSPLAPLCYDLHLRLEELPEKAWLENLGWSFGRLRACLGSKSSLLCLENTDRPPGQLVSLAEEHGFSFCCDLGHLLRDGEDWDRALRWTRQAAHIHYHGVRDGRDHQALGRTEYDLSRSLGGELDKARYQGVVTIEVYAMKRLVRSLALLGEAWRAWTLDREERGDDDSVDGTA